MDELNPYRSPDTPTPKPSDREDGDAVARGSPFASYFQPPPLRILHLLAWITVAAILIRIVMVFDAVYVDATGGRVEPFVRAMRFFSNSLTAGGIVGAGILVAGWVRGIRGPLQPGHWLIVVNGLSSTIAYALFLAQLALMQTVFWSLEEHRYLHLMHVCQTGFLSLLQIVLWYAAARNTVDGTRWKAFFGIVSASYGIRLLLTCIDALYYESWTFRLGWFFSVFLGSILVIVVVRDRRRALPRDWLHWVGVGIAIGLSLNALLWLVWKVAGDVSA